MCRSKMNYLPSDIVKETCLDDGNHLITTYHTHPYSQMPTCTTLSHYYMYIQENEMQKKRKIPLLAPTHLFGHKTFSI